MFTRNWDKALAHTIANAPSDSLKYKNYKGNELMVSSGAPEILKIATNADSPCNASLHKVRTSYHTYGGVVFGTGTTPPTKDDYCLSGTLLTNFSYSAGVTTTPDANGVTIKAIYTITNIGSADMTIGEIGLMGNIYSSGNTSANQSDDRKGFIERTVLDEPVTIQAGGVGTVTYTIRMNDPT